MKRHTFIPGMHSEAKANSHTNCSHTPCVWGFPSSFLVESRPSLGTRPHMWAFFTAAPCHRLPRSSRGCLLVNMSDVSCLLTAQAPGLLTASLFLKYEVGSVWPGCRLPWWAGLATWSYNLFLIYTMPCSLTKHQSQSGLGNPVQ